MHLLTSAAVLFQTNLKKLKKLEYEPILYYFHSNPPTVKQIANKFIIDSRFSSAN